MLTSGKGDFEDFEDDLSELVAISSEGKVTRAVPDLRTYFGSSFPTKLIVRSSIRATRDVYHVKGIRNRP